MSERQLFFTAKVSDNQDSDNQHRIQVTWKDSEDTVSAWIGVVSPFAGEDSGLYTLPEVDEQVLVLSADGSYNTLFAIGSLWSSSAKPPKTGENSNADLNQDGKNSLHFIKSRSGNEIIFDDTDKDERIQIIAAGSKTRLEFSIKDELINMDTDKDIGMSAKGIIEIKADEVKINASKNCNFSGDEFQIKTSKKMDINADQDISVKGSGVALN